MENLNNAFKELRKEGLFARQNLADCQSCAIEQIDEEKEVAKGKWGYVFYHGQDNDRKKEGDNFSIAFGHLRLTKKDRKENNYDDSKAIIVGIKVMQILERNGIKVDWNGKVERRIEVLQENH